MVALVSSVVGTQFDTLWLHDVLLGGRELFADYYEPDETYLLKVHIAFFEGSLAYSFVEVLKSGRPTMTKTTLLLKGRGREPGSIDEFIAHAVGHVNTFVIIETADQKTICGGFAAPAWVASGESADPDCESFMFLLQNAEGKAPMKFPKTPHGPAVMTNPGANVCFGHWNGVAIATNGEWTPDFASAYERRGETAAVFGGRGNERGGGFQAGRWELWQSE